jgi:glycosyltransferase involved in cell wall biosynthesis
MNLQPDIQKKKIKVVWICHFTNTEIQSLLPLWSKQDEFASWIPNLLKGFENREDIEIHVIAPHNFLKKSTNLIIRNIHFYFIPFGIPIWHRHWPEKFTIDVYTNYYFFRRKVKHTIKQIKPNLINLIGAENSYYSSSILDFKKDYPILVLIQGFISQMKETILLTPTIKKRIEIEEKILKSLKYYSGDQDSSTYISNFNSNHIFFRLYFPINEVLAKETIDSRKRYDCVFFGRLSKEKGVEDFIKIISIIKEKKPDVKACIIGGGDIQPLLLQANDLKCSANIEFTGFVKTQKELFEYVIAAKVFLAPPYFERLSSTIREAMLLKVPIVAYSTGSIPYINEFTENIYLIKTGDYQEMASKTILLLENETLRNNLAEKAYKFASFEFSLNTNTQRLISAYYNVLSECKKD